MLWRQPTLILTTQLKTRRGLRSEFSCGVTVSLTYWIFLAVWQQLLSRIRLGASLFVIYSFMVRLDKVLGNIYCWFQRIVLGSVPVHRTMYRLLRLWLFRPTFFSKAYSVCEFALLVSTSDVRSFCWRDVSLIVCDESLWRGGPSIGAWLLVSGPGLQLFGAGTPF